MTHYSYASSISKRRGRNHGVLVLLWDDFLLRACSFGMCRGMFWNFGETSWSFSYQPRNGFFLGLVTLTLGWPYARIAWPHLSQYDELEIQFLNRLRPLFEHVNLSLKKTLVTLWIRSEICNFANSMGVSSQDFTDASIIPQRYRSQNHQIWTTWICKCWTSRTRGPLLVWPSLFEYNIPTSRNPWQSFWPH